MDSFSVWNGGFNKVCVEQVSLARHKKKKRENWWQKVFSKRILAFTPAFGLHEQSSASIELSINPRAP